VGSTFLTNTCERYKVGLIGLEGRVRENITCHPIINYLV